MIKNFKPRLYQEAILASIAKQNTLVVLPTGLGKTNVFLMIAALRLKQYPGSKIILLGPTRPLIDQYLKVFNKYFEISEEEMVVFTGQIKPEKRSEMFKTAKIIFSTPQGLENDIISKRIDISNVSLIGFDEAHRGTGNYSYVFIADWYHKHAKYERIVALTASPGSDLAKVEEIANNFYVNSVEVRTASSKDVKEYIKDVKINYIQVELPESFKQIKGYLDTCFKKKLEEIKERGYLDNVDRVLRNKRELLMLQGSFQGKVSSGNADPEIYKCMSLAAAALKIGHAVELIETQGLNALYLYLEEIEKAAASGKTKAVQTLARDFNFRSALVKTRLVMEKNIEHPKIVELKKLLEKRVYENKNYRAIVFSQYRDSASTVVNEINSVAGVKSELFVGQAKKNGSGLSQKEQIAMLERFKNDEFNILVSSSVGEEGLDIPQVDEVIFFEPVPSAIRQIQRRGRTGRLEEGKVTILMTKDTRDESYRWVAHHKERRMKDVLAKLKEKLMIKGYSEKQTEPEHSLFEYISKDSEVNKNSMNTKIVTMVKPVLSKNSRSFDEKAFEKEPIQIYVDSRERQSRIVKILLDGKVDINIQKLDIGDYIVSSRCAIEYKQAEDFVNSLVDGRLLEQIRTLKENYSRPVIIIEGERDIYSVRNIHPNAIRGLISTIAVDYGIPIIYTKNLPDTTAMIYTIAKREQEELGKTFNPHKIRKSANLKSQQEYIVSSFPSVGPTLAKPLLKYFKSIKNIVNANEKQFLDVELIGPKKAKELYTVFNEYYKE